MHDLSKNFLDKLCEVDQNLLAIYDSVDDAIVINARRQGLRVHELTVKRKFGENYTELEDRTIQKLRECDVWKRFGTGKKYDDYLAESEAQHREKSKKILKANRLAMLKEDRELWRAAIWNAQHGRMTKDQALPYQTSSFSMSAGSKKESKASQGFTVIDKRRITNPKREEN